jgi:release factor glutamine methyltransferase
MNPSHAGSHRLLVESMKEKRPYFIELNKDYYIVYPGVFSPKYFSDTAFFMRKIIVRKNEEFLEIGSGTGIIAIAAARKGAKVTATDINPAAVRNTESNAALHSVSIAVKKGSVYAPVRGKRFDTIFWNVPFCCVERKQISPSERAIFDTGYGHLKEFILKAPKHLNPRGRLLIGFSSTIGEYDLLKGYLVQAGMKHHVIAKTTVKTMKPAKPVKLELIEAAL